MNAEEQQPVRLQLFRQALQPGRERRLGKMGEERGDEDEVVSLGRDELARIGAGENGPHAELLGLKRHPPFQDVRHRDFVGQMLVDQQARQPPVAAGEIEHPLRTSRPPRRHVPQQLELFERVLKIVCQRGIAIVIEQLHGEIEHVVALVDGAVQLLPARHARAQQRVHHRMRLVFFEGQRHGRG